MTTEGEILGVSAGMFRFCIVLVAGAALSPFHHLIKTPTNRHIFALVPGLAISLAIYGLDTLHPVSMVLYSHLLMTFLRPSVAPHAVLFFAMVHQTVGHIVRMRREYLEYTLDWTLSTMLVTFKLAEAAWSVRDGFHVNPNDLTPDQSSSAVRRHPTLLELFAFCFNFQGFVAGPWPEFRHYLDFAELKGIHSESFQGGRPLVPQWRNPAAVGRVFATIGAGVVILASSSWPEARMLDADFAMNRPLHSKLLHMIVSCELGSFKYFFTWWLGELACILSGMAFNGYDKDGKEKWDACLQVDLIAFQKCTDAKGLTSYWSMSPQRFLRRCVFQRLCLVVSKMTATQLTFFFSAFWHGLYPGYFLFFGSGALFGSVITSVKVRAMPFVFAKDGSPISQWRHWAFIAIFWSATHFVLDYSIVAFRMMSWSRSIQAWQAVNFSGHLVIGMFFIACLLLPPTKIRSG